MNAIAGAYRGPGLSLVDVRDVADLEIAAMTVPEAGGERFIAALPFIWMSEVAEILRDRLGNAAAKVPTRRVPNLLVRAMALFDREIPADELGRRIEVSAENAKRTLGWSPRAIEDTIAETAKSMIRLRIAPAPAAAT